MYRLVCCLIIAVLRTSIAWAEAPVSVSTLRIDFENRDALDEWRMPATARRQESGNHFLRLHAETPGMTTAECRFALPTDWKKLRIAVRMRAQGLRVGEKGYEDARLQYVFEDANKQMVGGWPSTPTLKADSDWVRLFREVDIPDGATVVRVVPQMLNTTGTVDFDDIVLEDGSKPRSSELQSTPRNAPLPKDTPADPQPEKTTRTRATLDLDGAWRFCPLPAGGQPPEVGWGYARVPGSWRDDADLLARGGGPNWDDFEPRALPAAVYEKTIALPKDWEGGRSVLVLDRVSTDAVVFVDGTEAGRINWPAGEVDLTQSLKPGTHATLRIRVAATTDARQVLELMGDAPGQNTTRAARLETAGLTGGVRLERRPIGATIDSVFVRTSTRQNQLSLDVDLLDVPADGQVRVTARMLDEQGQPEKEFAADMDVKAGPRQTVTLTWPWPDARRWDIGEPNRYTMLLSLTGAGVDDEYRQTFGFREFWIDGQSFYLNGTRLRLRPGLLEATDRRRSPQAAIQKLLDLNHNFAEIWPDDFHERGKRAVDPRFVEAADATGLAISGVAPHMGWQGGNIDTPQKLEAYRAAAVRDIKRWRNHPSILMWGTSGNVLGSVLDPAYVGQREAAAAYRSLQRPQSVEREPLVKRAADILKQIDPTRPVLVHNAGHAGDVYAPNHYLNLLPLQDRKEWLWRYAKDGDMPLMYVEFGTPVYSSLMRGRHGYGNTTTTEPLMTEYAATYFGTEAYRVETKAYRNEIVQRFRQGQRYESWHGAPVMRAEPAFQSLQKLFITETWRAWRTMGIGGGMIAWDGGYALNDNALTPAGIALRDANAPALAYIGGSAERFTAGDHLFLTGQRVAKQAILLNDTRQPTHFDVRWTAELAGRQIAQGQEQGQIDAGSTAAVPVVFAAPDTLDGQARVDGVIRLIARIGNHTATDTSAFRVRAPTPPSRGELLVFDPAGKSSQMLADLGYTLTPWDGQASDKLLVIGREALAGGRIPADLPAFARAGGRVLILQQHPDELAQKRGLRISKHITRRVFPVHPDHPVMKDLDAVDLRDWSSASTLLEPYPAYRAPDDLNPATGYPMSGWRWGTYGSVSAAAIEVPHRSGWTPLLACEFDLAYSPLMTLRTGDGLIVWCQLDLEDNFLKTPSARTLARNIIDYASTTPLRRTRSVVYLGGPAGEAVLDVLGVRYVRVESVPTSTDLLVIGAGPKPDEHALRTFLAAGGRALALAGANLPEALAAPQTDGTLGGFVDVPRWPELKGLCVADLRSRVDIKVPVHSNAPGVDLACGGLFARRKIGDGVLICAAIDPTNLDADSKTYLRRTRWRHTRALSQVLANLGGSFHHDLRPLTAVKNDEPFALRLDGAWEATLLNRLPPAASPDVAHADPGISPQATQIASGHQTPVAWEAVTLPNESERFGGAWADADGEAVYRRTFDLPQLHAGRNLLLSLGTIDDFDEVWVNGRRVGATDRSTTQWWASKRLYPVPGDVLRSGKNTIVVRVFDAFGGGGFTGQAGDMKLIEPPTPTAVELYHPDYRSDFELGDDPFRYYNW